MPGAADLPIASPSFADAPAVGTLSSFALADLGDINVTNGAVVVAALVPAVIVSHGKNGLGAYMPDGTQVAGALGNELEKRTSTPRSFPGPMRRFR
jgi:hypothetical protein